MFTVELEYIFMLYHQFDLSRPINQKHEQELSPVK